MKKSFEMQHCRRWMQHCKACDGALHGDISVAIVRINLPIITRHLRFRVSIMHVDDIKSRGFKAAFYALRPSASEACVSPRV